MRRCGRPGATVRSSKLSTDWPPSTTERVNGLGPSWSVPTSAVLTYYRDTCVRLNALDLDRGTEGPVRGGQRGREGCPDGLGVRDSDDVSDRAAVGEVTSTRDSGNMHPWRSRRKGFSNWVQLVTKRGATPSGSEGSSSGAFSVNPTNAAIAVGCGSQDLLRRRDLFDVDTWCCVSGHSHSLCGA